MDHKDLEKLRKFFWKSPFTFCLIYQADRGDSHSTGLQLKCIMAITPYSKSNVRKEALASKYYDLALDCFEHKRNFILEEMVAKAGSKATWWCGLNVNVRDGGQAPMNSLGQKWWHLAVSSGPIHKANCVLVARVAARNSAEVYERITGIQNVIVTIAR